MIGKKPQRTFCSYRGIQLPERTSRRIARIGENLFAGLFLTPVHFREISVCHVDLAPGLKYLRQVFAAQGFRYVGNGADVGGGVFAVRTVAAGRAQYQPAMLVTNTR